GGTDDDTVDLDVFEPPGIGAEQKGVADAAFVDELFVELADADAVRGDGGVLAGVRNDATADQCELLAARQRVETVVYAVPANARLQSREPAGLGLEVVVPAIAAGDHFEDGIQAGGTELAEGIGAANQGKKFTHVP